MPITRRELPQRPGEKGRSKLFLNRPIGQLLVEYMPTRIAGAAKQQFAISVRNCDSTWGSHI